MGTRVLPILTGTIVIITVVVMLVYRVQFY